MEIDWTSYYTEETLTDWDKHYEAIAEKEDIEYQDKIFKEEN